MQIHEIRIWGIKNHWEDFSTDSGLCHTWPNGGFTVTAHRVLCSFII